MSSFSARRAARAWPAAAVHLVTGLEPMATFFCRLRGLAPLPSHRPAPAPAGMVEKGLPARQLDAMHAARHSSARPGTPGRESAAQEGWEVEASAAAVVRLLLDHGYK